MTAVDVERTLWPSVTLIAGVLLGFLGGTLETPRTGFSVEYLPSTTIVHHDDVEGWVLVAEPRWSSAIVFSGDALETLSTDPVTLAGSRYTAAHFDGGHYE